MDIDQRILLPGLLAITGVVLAVGVLRRGLRRRRLAALASTLGLVFRVRDRDGLPHRFRQLTIMRQGHDRGAGNLLIGESPLGTLACFEYLYAVGFGAQHSVQRWAIAVLETTDGNWPHVCVRHQDWTGHAAARWDELDRRAGMTVETVGEWIGTFEVGDEGAAWVARIRAAAAEGDRPCVVEFVGNLLAVHLPLGKFAAEAAWLVERVRDFHQRLH